MNAVNLENIHDATLSLAEALECLILYREEINSLRSENEILKAKIEMLTEAIDNMRRQMFSPKSEKMKPSIDCNDEQKFSLLKLIGLLDDIKKECEQQAQETSEQSSEETENITYTRKKKRAKGENSEKSWVISRECVELVEHPSDDPTEIGGVSEKHCVCGANLIKIGEKKITKLEYIPGRFVEHQYSEPFYRCSYCSGDEIQGKPVLPMALTNELLPECLPTNDFLAEVIYNKYACSLPLHRQCMMYAELGVELNKSSLSRWIIVAGTLCEPLSDEILHQIQIGPIINMDETRLQVLNEENRENTQLSQLWYMRGGQDGPCCYFSYNTSRAGSVAAELIGPFQGFLQTDGYAGYNAVGNREGITHVGCLDHIRRKFVAAKKSAEGMTKTSSITDEILTNLSQIYITERELRELDLSPDSFLERRAAIVQPILDQTYFLIEKYRQCTPPKSLLGNALNYAHGQWAYFSNYLLHPALGPSNQLAENGIRPVAVGRKNYLFAGNPRGAKALAIHYSLIETAKANKISPLKYLKHVFSHIRSTPKDRMSDLLPWNCHL